MIDFVLDYCIERNALFPSDQLESIERGIKLFLLENGVPVEKNEYSEYFKEYIKRVLSHVDEDDIWAYMRCYPNMSKIKQLCIEYREDGFLPPEKKADLRKEMSTLYSANLGDKYLPSWDIEESLKEF